MSLQGRREPSRFEVHHGFEVASVIITSEKDVCGSVGSVNDALEQIPKVRPQLVVKPLQQASPPNAPLSERSEAGYASVPLKNFRFLQ